MIRKLTVTQLNNYIRGVFEDENVLQNLTVIGEVSELKRYGSRIYFTLKEGDCVISCISFRQLDMIEIGKSIEATGFINFYCKTGKISLMVNSAVPTGEGLELLRLKELKERLAKEGVFSNRPPLPATVKKIAVITSGAGAVIHDIISVVHGKNPLIDIALFDARVQGEMSAPSIIKAIKRLNEDSCGADVIIIARGGGSSQDLSSFNDEALARAVSASSIPIISAVGHQVDYTLCDLAASARAGTPSIAADMVTFPVKKCIERLFSLLEGIGAMAVNLYDRRKNSVIYSANRIVSSNELMIKDYSHKLISMLGEIRNGMDKSVMEQEGKLRLVAGKLDTLSPLKVLSKGYAKITKEGKEITGAAQLVSGDEINIIFADGKRTAGVK